MIITNSIAKSNLDNYVDKNGKISRDIKNGSVTTNGWFLTRNSV